MRGLRPEATLIDFVSADRGRPMRRPVNQQAVAQRHASETEFGGQLVCRDSPPCVGGWATWLHPGRARLEFSVLFAPLARSADRRGRGCAPGRPASAASVTVGDSLAASPVSSPVCALAPCTLAITGLPAGETFSAPGSGVITRWRVRVGSSAGSGNVALRVIRPWSTGSPFTAYGAGTSTPSTDRRHHERLYDAARGQAGGPRGNRRAVLLHGPDRGTRLRGRARQLDGRDPRQRQLAARVGLRSTRTPGCWSTPTSSPTSTSTASATTRRILPDERRDPGRVPAPGIAGDLPWQAEAQRQRGDAKMTVTVKAAGRLHAYGPGIKTFTSIRRALAR